MIDLGFFSYFIHALGWCYYFFNCIQLYSMCLVLSKHIYPKWNYAHFLNLNNVRICFDSQFLTDTGIKNINLHLIISSLKHEQGKRAFSTVKIFWCRGRNLQTLLEYEHRAEYQQHALNKHGKRERIHHPV